MARASVAKTFRPAAVIAAASVALGGCVLSPRGARLEEAALEERGAPYETTELAARDLPDLPPQPEWSDVVRRALLANGEVEAAYFEWAAALARVRRAGGYPNTPVSVEFEQMFENGTSFDDTSIRLGFDPMENLAFPAKVSKAAEVALDDARAARRRFDALRLDVQRRIMGAWAAYALAAERVRVQGEHLSLLELLNDTAVARVQAGAQQSDLLRSEIEQRRAQDELRTLETELPRMRATLNAMLARPPEAALTPPARIPVRPQPAADDAILALAADRNPTLAALAHGVAGRENALELARLQYIPDLNPFVGVTGTIAQTIGLAISIPTLLPEVRAMVDEARADVREAQAMYRQTGFDQAGRVVAALYAMRNSERQAVLFEGTIVPAAERIVENVRAGYSTGTSSFTDLIEAQRTLLETRLVSVEARAARETSLAELEALIGADLTTNGEAAPRSASSSLLQPVVAATSGGRR